ncbi:MAG TPA: hypothetical protein PKN38_00625, partial [Taishania sp.]|nr:hypothetical protein [Taishania sp.]
IGAASNYPNIPIKNTSQSNGVENKKSWKVVPSKKCSVTNAGIGNNNNVTKPIKYMYFLFNV